MSQQRKNEDGWRLIFEKYNIPNIVDQQGFFAISSRQINEFREARLMTKFDSIQSLPDIFRMHQVNILAVSNGQYILFRDENMQLYSKVEMGIDGAPESFEEHTELSLETLQFSSGMSESSAIDFAHHSGLLNTCFGEERITLTTRGRLFSSSFQMELPNGLMQEIKSVQIEVDAGFEGDNGFHIVEAKCGARDSFNIRQLYFPYRHFCSLLSKPVFCWLLVFSDGKYHMYRYEFVDNTLSFEIKETRVFELVSQYDKGRLNLHELIQDISPKNPEVPIPQANQVPKLLDAVTALSHHKMDKEELAAYFEMDERQGDYYGNALRYLGLATKSEDCFELSDLGKKMIAGSPFERHSCMLRGMLSTEVLHHLIARKLEKSDVSREYIIEMLVESGLQKSTAQRRAQTIDSWLQWVDRTFNSRQFSLF